MASDTSMPKEVASSDIRATPRLRCTLCGADGTLIYAGQRDRLFGAGGSWNFRKCSDQGCGLIWLDPTPVAEDLGKAYTNYYTHATRSGVSRPGLLKRVLQSMKRGYWAGTYGYPTAESIWVRAAGKLLYFLPLHRRGSDAEVKWLHAMPGGRLLDVGCGSGDWLLFMREVGWQVEGIDFDEKAVQAATRRGLKVGCGTLEEQRFPGASFDALILNHVIEHVPDPVGTVAECARILKPGGRLVICTPNGSSLGHQLFRQCWRGLEPPRHLNVFSMQTMQHVLERAGFREISVRPQIVKSVIYDSVLICCGQSGAGAVSRRNWLAEIVARAFTALELCVTRWKPAVADCVAAVAVK